VKICFCPEHSNEVFDPEKYRQQVDALLSKGRLQVPKSLKEAKGEDDDDDDKPIKARRSRKQKKEEKKPKKQKKVKSTPSMKTNRIFLSLFNFWPPLFLFQQLLEPSEESWRKKPQRRPQIRRMPN
jgi:hypothetical protein